MRAEDDTTLFRLWAKMQQFRGRPTDLSELPTFLEFQNWKRRLAAREANWATHHDAEDNYLFGSERTYDDLAEAVSHVWELCNEEAEIEWEAQAHRGEMPFNAVRAGETSEACDARIGAELDRRVEQDARTARLMQLWGPDVVVEAMQRSVRFQRRLAEAFEQTGVDTYTSEAVNAAFKDEYGLNDTLHGVED